MKTYQQPIAVVLPVQDEDILTISGALEMPGHDFTGLYN